MDNLKKENLFKNLVFCNSYLTDKDNQIKRIRETIENAESCTISELKERYSKEQLFNIALKHVTTTKKAICLALEIEVEGACRTKRKLEKKELLVQSAKKERCPITNHLAHLISTNQNWFDYLRETNTNQLKLEL